MFYVYILESQKNGRFYIGQTNNITDRLNRHNLGRIHSTRFYGPWKLLASKRYNFRSLAVRQERYLKSIKNKEYLLKITKGW